MMAPLVARHRLIFNVGLGGLRISIRFLGVVRPLNQLRLGFEGEGDFSEDDGSGVVLGRRKSRNPLFWGRVTWAGSSFFGSVGFRRKNRM